jgi:hypothetical protein
MNVADLKPGVIVRGPMLPEPIEVLVVTPLGDVVKLTGAGKNTGQVHQRLLHAKQLALLEASPETEPFDGDPLRFKLGVEAARLGLAYEYDPYFSLSIARVDPLPHQLEAVYDYFLSCPAFASCSPMTQAPARPSWPACCSRSSRSAAWSLAP